jgi:hypothetical protein
MTARSRGTDVRPMFVAYVLIIIVGLAYLLTIALRHG